MGALELVRARYGERCGYCGVAEGHLGATLTIDHHQPRSRGGSDDVENLVYCCARCNEYKGAYWHLSDAPGIALLHPGRDDLQAHLRMLFDGRLEGVTEEGDFFIHRLRLNRAQLIQYRTQRRDEETKQATLDTALQRVRDLEAQVESLTAALRELESKIERER